MLHVQNNICLVIPSLQAGGMERVMSELASYFCMTGDFDIHLVLYGRKREVFYPLPANITIHKPGFEFNNNFRHLYSIKTLLFLRRTIQNIDPFSILSMGEYWNSFVLLALFGTGHRVYISDRCTPDKNFGLFHEFLRRWLYPRAAGIIVQTSYAYEKYRNIFTNSHILVIGNPIKKISSGDESERENIILTVGRLIATKNFDRLISIFAGIRKPGWTLIIVGGNAQKQDGLSYLSKLITELGLSHCVQLAGEQSDVESYYRRSKIFAFTSSSEGFPNVIGEALSAGLPVVSYDCVSGPSEMIVDAENGFLVPLFDDTSFSMKLQQLMEDESLRRKMALNAGSSINKYSFESVGARFMDALRSER